MTRSRTHFGPNLLLAGTATGTTWLAANAWRGLTEVPGGFLNPLLLLAIAVAVTGTAARWWRWPAVGVLLAEVGVGGMLTSLLLVGTPLPVRGSWGELVGVVDDALTTAHKYAAPVPASVPPVDPLLVLGGLACLLLVDLLAVTLHRAPLAGLPLLAIFSIPVSMVGGGIPWWIFAATAAGFLMTLFLQESEQVARWGRPLGLDAETGDPLAFGAGAHTVRGTAGLVGGAATALAVLVPVVIPATGWHVFDFGPGQGGGDQIRVVNPTTDLVRDLKQGDDVPLIRITTTDPDPSYLRIVALTRFSDAEWSPGDRDVPEDHLANGQLPPPQGVAPQISREEFPWQVTVLPQFDSRWLPTAPPASRVEADGDWRYDDKTMDFLAGDRGLTTAGLSYSMTAVHLDLTAQRLADTAPSTGKVDDLFTDLPRGLPPLVRDLAVQVTAGATTPYEKAVALQQWFREDGGFTYTLHRAGGNGVDALVDFLSDGPGGREGYCEQFASAMAVMARMVGIPARVAVGFLKPSPEGPRTWVYSARDMHAWPELYFDGVGWVRFEPTPAGRAADVPAYTVPGSGQDELPSAEPSASESSAAVAPSRAPRDTQTDSAAGGSGSGGVSAAPWSAVLGVLAALVLLTGALLAPRLVRQRRRAHRLAAGSVEAVWSELRDTALDLGVPWPAHRSPRATRDAVVAHLGAPVGPHTPERPEHGPTVAPEAVASLNRLVLALELTRYARTPGAVDEVRLRADGETCVDSLLGGAPRSARRRAAWWPRSVLGSRRRATGPGTIEAPYGGVVDQVS